MGNSDSGFWARVIITIVILSAVFYFLLDKASSPDWESNSSPKTEQRQTQQERKQVITHTLEEKEYAEDGYKDGCDFASIGKSMGGFLGLLNLAESVATEEEVDEAIRNAAIRNYNEKYEDPTTSQQERLKDLYIEGYMLGFKNTTD